MSDIALKEWSQNPSETKDVEFHPTIGLSRPQSKLHPPEPAPSRLPSIPWPLQQSKHLFQTATLESAATTPAAVSQTVTQTEWWCIDLGQNVPYSAEAIARFAEACFRFTPDVVLGHHRIFLEMGRTKKLFSLDSMQRRAQVLSEWTGANFKEQARHWQWGIGKTIPQAWVQTRWKQVDPAALPVEAIFDYLDPMGRQQPSKVRSQQLTLNRRDQERVNLFYGLGIRTIQDLFKIPSDALLTRFGDLIDQFSKNFHEGHRFPWSRYSPELDLTEKSRWDADEWVVDSEALIFKIKPIVERVMSRLFALRRSLKKLELMLHLDSRSPDRLISLQFAFPQTSSQLLLKVLREKIAYEMQKEPLADPVISVQMKVLETAKREENSLRFQFSEADDSVHEGIREKWMELISYLSMQHGDAVFQAETTEHPLPEKSWKKVLLTEPSTKARLDRVSHLYPKRPLRLFREPLLLKRDGMFIRRAPVKNAFHPEEVWRICAFACEERLNGYEWDVEGVGGFDRTYYRVKVQMISGTPLRALKGEPPEQEWWVYKDEILNRLMLHGVYE